MTERLAVADPSAPGSGEQVSDDIVPPGPRRRCVGCRRCGHRSDLLRFVVIDVGGQATIALDRRRCLPGRGAWLHPDVGCWELARRRSALNRALRTAAPVQTVFSDVVAAATPSGVGQQQDGSTAGSSTARSAGPRPEPGRGHPTPPPPSAGARATGSGSER